MSEAQVNQLRWQCRRGMLELDYLLEGFLDNSYPDQSKAQQEIFRQFLNTSDPQLQAWLILNEEPPEGYLQLVGQITHRTPQNPLNLTKRNRSAPSRREAE